MALTKGTGPFGEKHSGTFNFDTSVLKAHTLYFEDSPKRVRAVFNGETVVDSRGVKLLHETGYLPVYYFPEEDVRMDLLEESDHTTYSPLKGDPSYWWGRVGDRAAENAVWSYPEPIDSAPSLSGFVAFYWNKMGEWYEESEQVFVHPRDPYHRVDVLDSDRHVQIKVNGEMVAETDRPKLLFETGLPTRYYIPPEDVREELLVPSDTKTQCPYKGVASYWSVDASGERVGDLIWYYPETLPAVGKIAGYLRF